MTDKTKNIIVNGVHNSLLWYSGAVVFGLLFVLADYFLDRSVNQWYVIFPILMSVFIFLSYTSVRNINRGIRYKISAKEAGKLFDKEKVISGITTSGGVLNDIVMVFKVVVLTFKLPFYGLLLPIYMVVYFNNKSLVQKA